MAHPEDPHDAGLAHDLGVLAGWLTRRRMLGLMARTAAGLSMAPLVAGCASDGGTADADPGGSCARFPEETAGPFPGDGTNGANALALSGIVRSDIRASLAGATGVADGVVLAVTLSLVASGTCAPLAGRAVYLWHCDRDGNYSMYSAAVVNENYLRGVQVTDAAGQVTFTTIFPGCYPGRWPHMHFEIYPTIAAATQGTAAVATSQLALPSAACSSAYATAGYSASASNLTRISLASDNVFSDGGAQQLAEIAGSVAAGYAAALTVPVNG